MLIQSLPWRVFFAGEHIASCRYLIGALELLQMDCRYVLKYRRNLGFGKSRIHTVYGPGDPPVSPTNVGVVSDLVQNRSETHPKLA